MSPFAEALKSLLDDTDFFSRSEWSEFFFFRNYSSANPTAEGEAKIESWLEDKAIPSPTNLHMLVGAVEYSDTPKGPLDKFNEIADKPAVEVSPLGKRMLPTVREYKDRPAFSELSSKLAKLTAEEQEALLESMYLKKA